MLMRSLHEAGGDSDAESEVDPEEEAYITQGAAELGRHRERGVSLL